MKIMSAIGALSFVCASVSGQTLERGDNEFGFWGGFSPKATTIFEGRSEAEAENREVFVAAFRYGRTLAANDTLAFQWTVDGVPVAGATGAIVSRRFAAGTETCQRETADGAGLTPRGLR